MVKVVKGGFDVSGVKATYINPKQKDIMIPIFLPRFILRPQIDFSGSTKIKKSVNTVKLSYAILMLAMARNCSAVASPQAHHFSIGRTAAR